MIKKMNLIFPNGGNDFKLINKIWLVRTKGGYDLASMLTDLKTMLTCYTILITQRDL